MSNIQNIEHSITVIGNIGSTVEDILEKKKNEVIATSGGVAAAGEVIKIHKEFMEKMKAEFTEKVKSNAMTLEIANMMLKAMGQSHDVLVKFLADKTAQNNMKKGEVLAYDAQVKLLKSNYDSMEKAKQDLEAAIAAAEQAEAEAKAAAELEEKRAAEETEAAAATSEVVSEAAESVEEKKEPKKRGRKRPDEVGKLGETVKRLKEARRKNKVK